MGRRGSHCGHRSDQRLGTAEVQSIRGERAGTLLPASLDEALALLNKANTRNAELEAEIERLRRETA